MHNPLEVSAILWYNRRVNGFREGEIEKKFFYRGDVTVYMYMYMCRFNYMYRTCSIIRPPFLHRSSAKKKGGGAFN